MLSNPFKKPATLIPNQIPAPTPRQLPAGILEIDEDQSVADPDLVALAVDGWIIKQKIDALGKEFDAIKKRLIDSLPVGAQLRVDDVTTVSVIGRCSFKLTDAVACRKILEGRFDDLVNETPTYKITDKLKDMTLDPDHPLSEALRACFSVDDSVTATFRPGKPL